jgi:hypothetical protein
MGLGTLCLLKLVKAWIDIDSLCDFVKRKIQREIFTMVKYSVPASILLSQSLVAASLYDSYVSLSFELIGFPTFAGEFHTHDTLEASWTD